MSCNGVGQFLSLHKRAVVGDYAILFNLKSNISFRTITDPHSTEGSFMFIPDGIRTSFMCCKRDVFLDLCELYPETEEALKELSLHKREIYLHYLKTAKNMKDTIKHSGVPRGIDSRSGLFRKKTAGGAGNARNLITLSDDEGDKAK